MFGDAELRKAFQYRATMNERTEAACENVLERCRELYNAALEQRIMVYEQTAHTFGFYEQNRDLTLLRSTDPRYAGIDAQCLANVLRRLDLGFQSFFRRVKAGRDAGFPRFRGRNRYDSFTLRQTGWKIEGRYLHLSRVGRLKLFLSRPIEGRIKTVTVRKTATGKWFVSFSCDEVPERVLPSTGKTVGIDVGISSFATDSDGGVVDNPLFLKRSLSELRRKQRRLARCKYGSRRRSKAKRVVARQYEKVASQRRDFLHKVANFYVLNYDRISVEDLNVAGMMKNRHLARSIADSSWYTFLTMLSYKAEEAGREAVKVNARGTSQICSSCGEDVPKKLSQRIHACPHCGVVLDRDLNAALNILRRGTPQQAQSPSVGLACELNR